MGAVCGSGLSDASSSSMSESASFTSTATSLHESVCKPSQGEIDKLDGLLIQAHSVIDAAAVRRIEAHVVQSVQELLRGSDGAIREALQAQWTARCASLPECCSSDILSRIVVDVLHDLMVIMMNHAKRALTIVAEAERTVLQVTNTNSDHAKRSSNRNKAKLMIELNLERNTQGIIDYIGYVEARVMLEPIPIVMKALRPLSAVAIKNVKASSSTSPSSKFESTAVSRETFINFATSLVLSVVQTSALVEAGSFLQLTGTFIHAYAEMKQAAKDEPPLSAKVHALQAALFTSSGGNSTNRSRDVEQYCAVVAHTPAPLLGIFAARERQLEYLIDQVHGVEGLNAMGVTLTSASGSVVVEFDSSSDVPFSFRSFSSATNVTIFGRYCRVSPVVVVLLALQRQSSEGIVEYDAETVTLVRQPEGWRDVSTGDLLDTVIPHLV